MNECLSLAGDMNATVAAQPAAVVSVVLIPYCPWPADTGGKTEMWKHLAALRELGPCTILSAAGKPVGVGWTREARCEVERRGFKVVLREQDGARRSWRQWAGLAYAAVAKGLGLERAFGHSNPYHRFAFPAAWWYRHTQAADLAVVHYSFWAGLPCACPKVVALLDLWSDYMWEGPAREVRDLKSARLITVISKEEEQKLQALGLRQTLWSPPVVAQSAFPDSDAVGLLGSPSPVNREGLQWLSGVPMTLPVRVYGGLAEFADAPGFVAVGKYEANETPYRECGIIFMPTALGMGVQIKGIEALASGRAIVARRGAMRGIPAGNGAWIEVDTPGEMLEAGHRLQRDPEARGRQMAAAREYYHTHLDSNRLCAELRAALLKASQATAKGGEA